MIQVVLIHSHWSFDQRCLGWGHNLWKGARPCAMWRNAQGRWANHFFAFLHFGSNAAQLPPHKRLASTFQPTMKLVIEPASAILCIPWCQPWPFNGPFWNSVWLLVWFPSAATIKWLASTFQPTMKLWLSICHPFAFLDASPGVSMGHFGIVCGYLYDFQVLPL